MSGHGEAQPMKSRKSGPLKGVAEVPGDKSISHRSLIFGAMAVGETRITGLLEGQDVLDTAKAMRAFGAVVTRVGEGAWTVNGVGVGGFREPADVLESICRRSEGTRWQVASKKWAAFRPVQVGSSSLCQGFR